MADNVHKIAQLGFGEGTNELYDKYRPTYPDEQLDYVYAAVIAHEADQSLNVLEVGSGTGIFTRCLLKHKAFGPAIKEIIAVEPSSGMRDQFTASVKNSRVSCRAGTFESTGLDGCWADLVFVAQAWHWCPDYDKAMAEFARVLKPGGSLVLIWNLEDGDTPWVASNRMLYEAYEEGTPQFRLGLWRKMYNVPSIDLFPQHEEHEVNWSVPTNSEAVVARVFTKSYITVLPEAEKAKLREAIVQNTENGEGRLWISEQEGVWEYPYKSLAAILHRK